MPRQRPRTQPTSVSLWLGTAKTTQALNRALTIRYTAAGDSKGSAFGRAFALKYDDDFREAARMSRPARSLDKFLAGISYDEQAIPALAAAGATLEPGDNCFVCLYDYRHRPGRRTTWKSKDVTLRFAAVVEFERPVTDVSRWMAK
jgi:hypothetical protein